MIRKEKPHAPKKIVFFAQTIDFTRLIQGGQASKPQDDGLKGLKKRRGATRRVGGDREPAGATAQQRQCAEGRSRR